MRTWGVKAFGKAVADTVNRGVTATGGVTLKSVERNTVVKAAWIKWYEKE